ncbi:RTA1-domain-containing protein [Trichodelitschia bisporula]|uniref:RTA1-domain-containing protein n=1 Tax=Trichodelitschia bisporula TaxID=703511 RepID=A0A6G1HPX9_9PEZI|nr:RTA1-domain-containing protein [Trichodelitschia bisporula]
MSNLAASPDCFSKDYATRRACREACTLETCPLKLSYWAYQPSQPANGLFAALFGLSLLASVLQGLFARRWIGFTVAMCSGSVLELLGYIGRYLSYDDPFNETWFLLQIITLTIAPAFYAAGIYFCLRRIVTTFGASNSVIPPAWYPRIFIPCDVFSLLLQAAGGGLASSATHSGKNPTAGNNIMIAGLSFQVATLAVFIALASLFGARTWKRVRAMGEAALDPAHRALRESVRFQGFLTALAFATLCVFTRSVYRVAELSEGWTGHLIETQRYFIGLEGAVLVVGILGLNVFHPGWCFREDVVAGAEGTRSVSESEKSATVDGEALKHGA